MVSEAELLSAHGAPAPRLNDSTPEHGETSMAQSTQRSTLAPR